MNDQIITHQECSFCDECFIIPNNTKRICTSISMKIWGKERDGWGKNGLDVDGVKMGSMEWKKCKSFLSYCFLLSVFNGTCTRYIVYASYFFLFVTWQTQAYSSWSIVKNKIQLLFGRKNTLLYGKSCPNLTTMLVDFSSNNSLACIILEHLQIDLLGHVFYIVNM